MKPPLQVLIIEDAERDALLLARQLQQGGYVPTVTRVESAVELKAALQERTFDLVLCDYRLPQFNALEALAVVQTRGLDVPFILVSGVIGEDQAVAALKAGAHDFILKDKLARLVPAVERELREAEMRRQRRQAEEQLQHQLQQLRRVVDVSIQVLSAGSQSEVLQHAANAALALAGARFSTASYGCRGAGHPMGASARTADAPPCPSGDMFCTVQGRGFADLLDQTPFLRLNDAELRAHPAWSGLPEGHVPLRGLLGVRLVAAEGLANGLIMVSDRTAGGDFTAEDQAWLQQLGALTSLALQRLEARQRAEESAAETRQLTESLPQLVWSCEPSGACDYLSRQWLDFTGIPQEQQLSFGWLDQLHPDDHSRAVARWAEAVKAGTPFDLELRIRGANGAFHWFKSRSVPIRDAAGKIVRWYGTNTDIEDLKRAESALQNAHNELETKVRERTAELVTANTALQRANRALKTISECSVAIVNANRESELLDWICTTIVKTGGYRSAWVGFGELDRPASLHPVAQAGSESARLETTLARWTRRPDGPFSTALRTRRPCLQSRTEVEPNPGGGSGTDTALSLPLLAHDECLGVLVIHSASPDSFDRDETKLLLELASDLALGILMLRTRLERDLASRALEQWGQLFHRAGWGVATLSADGETVGMANPAFAEMHGYTMEEVTGSVFTDFFAPDCRADARRQMLIAEATGRAIFESRHQRKEGTSFPALVDVSTLHDDQGRILYRIVYTQDISELKSLEARILDISEREQQRIGRDLHDSLCQQLSGIAYLCNAAQERFAKIAPQEVGALDRISALLQEAVDQARSLARGLHPVEREANGLTVALQNLVAGFRHIYRVSARFVCGKPVLIADNATATHLYRIAQEAMNNAVKHGRADQIIVRLSESKDRVTLSVKDNGCGFPAELPESDGLGLQTMRFRARAIGAELNIARGDERGTVLTCILRKKTHPITAKASDD